MGGKRERERGREAERERKRERVRKNDEEVTKCVTAEMVTSSSAKHGDLLLCYDMI